MNRQLQIPAKTLIHDWETLRENVVIIEAYKDRDEIVCLSIGCNGGIQSSVQTINN